MTIAVFAALFSTGWVRAQTPLDDTPDAVQAGLRVFRVKCARCHDLNGQGYKGRDLTQLSSRNLTNAQLSKIVSDGIPGSEMPATKLDSIDLTRVVSYVRSLGGPAVVDRGDARRGEALFWGRLQCGKCHMLAGRGGRLGPNLTQIGALRSKPFLIREVRSPSEYIAKGFDPVVVVTASGERITGVLKNEDLFSIQMMDEKENIRLFTKKELREVMPAEQSLMPVYGPRDLTDEELDDLLRYLASLR